MKLYKSLIILIQHLATFRFGDWLDSDPQMSLESGVQLLKPLVEKKLREVKRVLTDIAPDVVSYVFYTRGMAEHFAKLSIEYSSDGSLRYSSAQMRLNFLDILQDALDNMDEELNKEQRDHLSTLLRRHSGMRMATYSPNVPVRETFFSLNPEQRAWCHRMIAPVTREAEKLAQPSGPSPAFVRFDIVPPKVNTSPQVAGARVDVFGRASELLLTPYALARFTVTVTIGDYTQSTIYDVAIPSDGKLGFVKGGRKGYSEKDVARMFSRHLKSFFLEMRAAWSQMQSKRAPEKTYAPEPVSKYAPIDTPKFDNSPNGRVWSVVSVGRSDTYAAEVETYDSKYEAMEAAKNTGGDCYVVEGTQMWNEPLGQVEEHDREAKYWYVKPGY